MAEGQVRGEGAPSPGRREGAPRAGEGLAQFREGEPPCEPPLEWARTEPRPPKITKGRLDPQPTNHEIKIQLAAIAPGEERMLSLGDVEANATYRLLVSCENGAIDPADRIAVELSGADGERPGKTIHAGDPDFYLPYRPARSGHAALKLKRTARRDPAPLTLRVAWAPLALPDSDRAAIEAEPNDSWQTANLLKLGRDIYGTADDVDYLENLNEGKSGLDWFRFEVTNDKPILVYFQLDLLDRDVSANLRVYALDPKTGRPEPYLTGKDPMEIIHDRERERYSKHISRTFSRGTYYLEVNANHPDYILRTRVLPVPPYTDPAQAVEAGMHYIINVGDAWFAQVPREGNIYVRAANMHDTATRCTACHPSSFSTEANLVAHQNGYPIRSKSNFQYVIDRLYNSITPLYGNDGLYWQRFIAIPLQAQGKQGGILLNFERQVARRAHTYGRATSGRSCSEPGSRASIYRPMSSTVSCRWIASSALPGATGVCSASWPSARAAKISPRPRRPSSRSSTVMSPTSRSKRSRIGSTASMPGG